MVPLKVKVDSRLARLGFFGSSSAGTFSDRSYRLPRKEYLEDYPVEGWLFHILLDKA